MKTMYNNISIGGGKFTQPSFKYVKGTVKVPDLKAMLVKDKLKVLGYFVLKNVQIEEKNFFNYIDLEILLTSPKEWDTYAK
jgi:hypothetical protein